MIVDTKFLHLFALGFMDVDRRKIKHKKRSRRYRNDANLPMPPSAHAGCGSSLASYAEQYGKAERTLFSKLAAGDDAGKLKSSFMKEHSLTARQFNAMAFSIQG